MASTRSKRSQNPYRTLKEPVKAVVLGLSRQSVSFPVIHCHHVSSGVIRCHFLSSGAVTCCHSVSSGVICCHHSVSFSVICCHPLSSGVISCHLILFSWCPTTPNHTEWVTKPLRMVAKTTRVGQGTQSGSVQRGRLAEVAVAGGPADAQYAGYLLHRLGLGVIENPGGAGLFHGRL